MDSLNYSLNKLKDPFILFERRSASTELNLLNDFGFQINDREDLIAIDSASEGYVPYASDDMMQYYSINGKEGEFVISYYNSTPECLGYGSDPVLTDGSHTIGESRLTSPK